jgi:DNA-binding transcriptional LysR family regulator
LRADDREPLCAVLPARHRLAPRARVPLAALADEAFALFPRQRAPVFYDLILDSCKEAGFRPRITHEAAEWQALASLVAAGLVVTLAPESVRNLPRAGVVYRPIRPSRDIAQLDVVYSAAHLSPVGRALLAVAREVGAERKRGAPPQSARVLQR